MWSVLAAIVAALLLLLIEDSYLRAWILSVMAAIAALYILSVPRYLKVNDDSLEIHCVLEMTRIEMCDIASVKPVSFNDYPGMYPILGSYGFFGYYGYWFDFRHWDLVKVYATDRKSLVEIEDVFEQKYIVSCSEPRRLAEAVMQAKLELTETGCECDD